MKKTWSTQRVFTFDNGGGDPTESTGDEDVKFVDYPSPHGGLRWMDVEKCDVCGRVYHVDEMVKYEGKWYCIPRGCYHDIDQFEERKVSRFGGAVVRR